MKILTTIIATAILGLGMVSSVQARSVVHFKKPVNWAGTGCKAGSTTVIGVSSDTLRILFDSYEAGKESGSGKKRVACSFTVPIKVQRGFQVSHLTADWESYVEGKGQLSRKYYLEGRSYTGWKRNTYRNSGGGSFTKRDNIYHASFATACNGGTYNLRINSHVKAQGRNSYIAVDSRDVRSNVLFRLHLRRCR